MSKGQFSHLLLVVILLGLTIGIVLLLSPKQKSTTPIEPAPQPPASVVSGPFPATEMPAVNAILGTTNNNFGIDMNQRWAAWKCPVAKEKSLVNLVHIKKTSSGYEIKCTFGPQYKFLNYTPRSGSYEVYAGWLTSRKCDEEVAKAIDKAAREMYNCEYPLYKPLSEDVTDYYAFFLICGAHPNEAKTRENECFARIPNRLYIGYRGIVIPSTGEFIL